MSRNKTNILILLFAWLMPFYTGNAGIKTDISDIEMFSAPSLMAGHYCLQPVKGATEMWGEFASIEEAAKAASDQYNPLSIRHDREFMGAILQDKADATRFFYTVGSGHSGQDTITVKIRFPKSYRLVGFWHTHGAPHWDRTYFSDIDSDLVNKWGLPFYLADHTGHLKVLRPDDRLISAFQARKMGLGSRPGYAMGTPVTDFNGRPVYVATQMPDEAKLAQFSTKKPCSS